MTPEQKIIILEGIVLGEACGLTDLSEYYNNQCRVLHHYARYEDIPAVERGIVDAWFEFYKEIFAPHVSGYTEELVIDDMFEWMYQRAQNAINEIQGVRALVMKCKENGDYTAEVKELQKYGY